MTNMWTIKAIYPSGGHIVNYGNEPLRFDDKQAAYDKAEMMNAVAKKTGSNTFYIVVQEQ